MAALTEDLAGLVETVVAPLVEVPEALEISASENDRGDVLVEIKVDPCDVGKVIGRQGRVIKAIRTLARAAGSRSGSYVDVELID